MNITQIKYECQENFNIFGFITVILTFAFLFLPSIVLAIANPRSFPNNKFGIHIISPTHDEASAAAELVNSNGGDWGYVTILIESKDRNKDKWQTFFNDLRKRHLIPIIRLATYPQGNFWQLPQEGEEAEWANFLDSLNWPTKNRYVIIYNEPNQGQEWGGSVDAKTYAQVLDKTITALKDKNSNFFVLNAGFDASAPQKPPLFQDEVNFLQQMNDAVPGIFDKLDGWVSHSYPNPGFAGSPKDRGRGTIGTWIWELELLRQFQVKKNLPVFITETGWKHAEGVNFDKSFPTSETIGEYFQQAFQEAWSSERIIAVTPFLLNYQDSPFDHFSFKKMTGERQDSKILGLSYPNFYPQYQTLAKLDKKPGQPYQENKALFTKGMFYTSMVAGESYALPLTFKNTGQSVWNEDEQVSLRLEKGREFESPPVLLPPDKTVAPGEEFTFSLQLKAPGTGLFNLGLQLYEGNRPFDQKPWEFTTYVKSPVILLIHSTLYWKENFGGKYLLSTTSDILSTISKVDLDEKGNSQALEARTLLPDQTFTFTLSRPFYKAKTVQLKVKSGINNLDFGKLEPDLFAAILQPKELWRLLPFSN